MICLRIGKTYTAKTSLGDFKVNTLENLILSKQAVTSKGIPVPYTNLQLNSYPNTQLDLFYSDNISFSMHGSQYVTNQQMRKSQYLIPTYSWTITPIPNWTCSAVTISHFQCMAPSMWLTNCMDPSTRLNHQLKKNVGCKVLQFITRWRSRSSLVTKPYGVQT